MIKKTTLAVLGLAVSGFAAAGTMGPVCTPGNVTVPCEAKAWDLGIQALYLEPITSGEKSYQLASVGGIGGYDALDQSKDWDWGYRAEGSYHFNTGNDFTINWTHFSNTLVADRGFGFILPLQMAPSTFTEINTVRYDQVNLVMGQHADFGLVKKMRFYGGLQYAYIQSNNTNYYNLQTAFGKFNLVNNSDFRGVGPVVGMDYSYNITDSFSVIANGAGSILYGTGRFNYEYVASPSGGVAAPGYTYASKKSIVPSLEAKLGLNYAYAMAQGILNLEGGYQVVNYFNVLQSYPLQTGLLINLVNPIDHANFGLQGPYFGVKYVGYS